MHAMKRVFVILVALNTALAAVLFVLKRALDVVFFIVGRDDDGKMRHKPQRALCEGPLRRGVRLPAFGR